MKIKKQIYIPIIVILSIIFCVVYFTPAIETRTWVLSLAQKTEPFSVVAHKVGYDFSDDDSNLFASSKEIDLICEAKDGKLTLTDKTNEKTYEGTYKVTSLGGFGRFSTFGGQKYSVVIEGIEGTANISSSFNRTLFISVGGYTLNFDAQ